MTNLIEKVAELRKLEEKATSAWKHRRDGESFNVRSKIIAGNAIFASEYQPNATCDSACDDAELAVSLRNAAPMLLDALGKIQTGDAAMLNGIIQYLIEDFEEGEHSCQMVAWLVNHRDDTRQDMIDLLRRYRGMAKRMEAMR